MNIKASFYILLGICMMAASCSSESPATVQTSVTVPLVTPTPDPLPTMTMKQPSTFARIFNQIFGKKSPIPTPIEVMAESQKVAENEHFEFYSESDALPVDLAWWEQQADQVYAYVGGRINFSPGTKIRVVFLPPQTGNCAPRGLTYHEDKPMVLIFANQQTSQEQILAVFAHELGHAFLHQKFVGSGDVALNEGMTTWAAGDYWRAWQGASFDDSVRAFLENGTYMSLFQNYDLALAYQDTPGCLERRDTLLTETASFLDYLIRTYGFENIGVLFNIPEPEQIRTQLVIYPPDYRGVYGYEFNQLEAAWLQSLLDK
jgi:hypothetical protein